VEEVESQTEVKDEDSTAELKLLLDQLPEQKEMEGAAQGIFLLQETYDLNLAKLTKGLISVPLLSPSLFHAKEGLESRDTEFLGKVAYNRGFYDRSVLWFRETLSLAEKEGLPKNQTKVFQSQLRAAIKTHDKTLDLKGPTGSVGGLEWRTNPVPFDEKLKKKKKFKKIKNDKFTPSVGQENHPHVVAEQFSRLCRSGVRS